MPSRDNSTFNLATRDCFRVVPLKKVFLRSYYCKFLLTFTNRDAFDCVIQKGQSDKVAKKGKTCTVTDAKDVI